MPNDDVPLVVAVDMDGVICDHVSPLLPRLSRLIGRKLERKEITSWDYRIGRKSLCDEVEKSLEDRRFALTFPPIRGATNGLRNISKFFKIVIVSSRNLKHIEMTKEWLLMHNIRYPLLMTREKQKIEANVLIDDNLEFTALFARRGRVSLLFSQPWNSDHSEIESLIQNKSIIPCKGWPSVVATVKRLTQSRTAHLLHRVIRTHQHVSSLVASKASLGAS